MPCLQVVSGDGSWKAASLDAAADTGASGAENGAAAPPLMEFVITDGFDSWDKAPEGGNYVVREGGVWQLADGLLAQAERPPVLLVSDLDDTMIGDDAATAAFTRWWQEEAVPAGGRLVFNTGRVRGLGRRGGSRVAGVAGTPPTRLRSRSSALLGDWERCATAPIMLAAGAGPVPGAAGGEGRPDGAARHAHQRHRHPHLRQVRSSRQGVEPCDPGASDTPRARPAEGADARIRAS